MPLDPSQAAAIVDDLRAALVADDPGRFRARLRPDVRWGAPDDPSPACQNRDQVLAWYRHSHDAGVRAEVTGADVRGDKILVAVTVTGSRAGEGAAGATERWQVLTIRDGLIADIRAFEERGEAEAVASTPDVA